MLKEKVSPEGKYDTVITQPLFQKDLLLYFDYLNHSSFTLVLWRRNCFGGCTLHMYS